MKRLNAILIFLISTAAVAGNESGAGGDPFLLEFYHRGTFVLEEIRLSPIVTKSLVSVFEEAVTDLRVEMSNLQLPYMGWVIDDPKRPGKRKVVLDTAQVSGCLS